MIFVRVKCPSFKCCRHIYLLEMGTVFAVAKTVKNNLCPEAPHVGLHCRSTAHPTIKGVGCEEVGLTAAETS